MMHNRSLAIAATLVLASTALCAQQGTQLTPPKDRISDAAIQADHQSYEALQGRIKALNDRGRPLRDYHLSKAQCWLDVSLHEYTRNDPLQLHLRSPRSPPRAPRRSPRG